MPDLVLKKKTSDQSQADNNQLYIEVLRIISERRVRESNPNIGLVIEARIREIFQLQ